MEYGLVLLWLAVLHLLAVLGVPVAKRLLPDRVAFGVALPVSLVVVTTVVYWLGHVTFGRVTVIVGLAVLVVLAGVTVRETTIDWRAYLQAAGVFTVAFLFMVAVRAVDPGIIPFAGEKFLDYGLLKTLLRSSTLPPQDFWFAGEAVQYYYGGHLITAILTILTDTSARFAYNLALSTFYAMLVTVAFGFAAQLAADRDRSPLAAGAFGAFLVGFASNLMTPFNLVRWLLPRNLAEALSSSDLTGLANGPGAFFYWTASRVIPGTINEFPLFAFLNGDLHAHMMSTPFLLLAAAITYAYYRTPGAARKERRVLVFGAIPVVGGLLAVVNTWSFPSVVGLTVLTVLFAESDPATLYPDAVATPVTDLDGVPAELARMTTAGATGIVVALLGVLWSLPFFLDTASGRAVAFLPDRSPFGPLLLVHGVFLAIAAWYLWTHLPAATKARKPAIVALIGAIVLAGTVIDFAVAAVVLPLLVVAWILLRSDRDVGFPAVLFVAGAGLVLIVELAYVDELAAPQRMNTVFKTYMQVWVLWSVGAAAMLADRFPAPDLPVSLERATTAVVVALVISTSLYGAFALSSHFADAPEPSLDGTAYVEDCRASIGANQYRLQHCAPGDTAAAIEWLDARDGQPVIVTAPADSTDTGMYDWGNAPSSLTGLPTVAGWGHEIGYRGPDGYRERLSHVTAIYVGENRDTYIEQYDVTYVYVGPRERARYGDVTFDDGVTVAYRNDAVTIYEVEN